MLTLENIQEEFINACTEGNKNYIHEILNHPYSGIINYTQNDYQALKLVESLHPELLELVLLQRVKTEGRIEQGNFYIDANTYYCVLSEKSQRNPQLAKNILLKGNEYLSVIPNEIKTPDFLEQLSQHYKQDIFDFEFIYTIEYKKFLIEYIKSGHSFSKKIKLSEDLINDKDFVLQIAKYPCNAFMFVEHVYAQNKEIMTLIAVNEKQAFQNMSAKMRNIISKNEITALKLIEINPSNFQYLNKEMQINEKCIHTVLKLKPAIYEVFLPEVKNNENLTIEYITQYNIDMMFLSDEVKTNKQIATIMTGKDGVNLQYFDLYKNDESLVSLALQTSKKLSLIPEEQRTLEKIKQIVLLATKEENSFNLHYLKKEIKEDRSFIMDILEHDLFFKEDLYALVNDYGNHREDYEIIKQCIIKHNDLYGRFYRYKDDYEIIHLYIEGMKKERNGQFSLNAIPQKIKAEASMLKAPVDKYVLNKTLEKKSQEWQTPQTIKVKKTKI